MSNRLYEKGRRAEYELVNSARALGFDARRTAGSKGPYDVAITDGSHQWLVNIKCNGWATPRERLSLSDFVSEWTTGVLACRLDGGKWRFRIVDKAGVMTVHFAAYPWAGGTPFPKSAPKKSI